MTDPKVNNPMCQIGGKVTDPLSQLFNKSYIIMLWLIINEQFCILTVIYCVWHYIYITDGICKGNLNNQCDLAEVLLFARFHPM